jgi:hypothetical protein
MFRFLRASSPLRSPSAPSVPEFHALESRQLLSAAVLRHGTLTVYGSDGDDTITLSGIVQPVLISGGPNGQVVSADYQGSVTVNGQVSVFEAADIRRVRIYGLAGNDTITVQDSLTSNLTNVTVDAGDGDDVVTDATKGHRYNRREYISVINAAGHDHLIGGPHMLVATPSGDYLVTTS